MNKYETIISIYCLLNIIIFPLGNSLLPESNRKFLFNKYIKQIFSEDLIKYETMFTSDKNYPIEYDIIKIQNIIKKNKFPEKYDFIENEKPTIINIKSQGTCGCCWAMSSTTSLAYRFHKKGVEVDLSPQHALSCYKKECKNGNYVLDAFLNLVRNGTVTEDCFEFSSKNGNVEECRTSCKNSKIAYEKYYAKKAFVLKEDVNKTNFYDIVTFIMDELIRNGPVYATISDYADFKTWFIKTSQKECHEKVFTHKVQKGEKYVLHAVTIVGYGFTDNKYYWLIQNSWGKKCDNGFAKIEFGQIGIESISFAEPFIENKEAKPQDIKVYLNNFDDICNLKITCSKINKWRNPLLIQFKHTSEEKYFDYICDYICNVNRKCDLVCNFEKKNLYHEQVQGVYKFNDYKALGKYGVENNFILDKKIKKKEFNFYGYKYINSLTESYVKYFISRNGSKISFYVYGDKSVKNLSPIYPMTKNERLSNCYSDIFMFNGEKVQIGNCEIDSNEVNYFKDITITNSTFLTSKIYCGYTYTSPINVYLLDTKNYPVFIITEFKVLPHNEKDKIIYANLFAKIEGNINLEYFFTTFTTFINVGDKKEDNYEILEEMNCYLGLPTTIVDNYTINCEIINNGYSPKEKFYLYPYYYIRDYKFPFEIIIPNKMKNEASFLFPKQGIYLFIYLILLI